MAAYRNIAIIRLSSLGDVIMALPAVEALRHTYPDARITWIAEDRTRAILDGFTAIDEIVIFPGSRIRSEWRRPFGSLRVTKEILSFRKELRQRRFDLSIDFQGNLKSGLCTLLAGAPVRLGYERDQCREPNYLFTNSRLKMDGQDVHRMDRDLLLVGLAGVPFEFRRPRLRFSSEDEQAGLTCLPAPHEGPPAVILHPGTSPKMPNKRWPPDRYARLADRLQSEAGARILLSFGPGEEGLVDEIKRTMSRPCELLPSTPPMRSLAFLISRCDLFVGGDTGPVHLAVALGVPTLNLIGPMDPRHYYPHGHPERTFFRRVPCAPCRYRTCPTRTCMDEIEPDEVAEVALSIIR